MHPRSKTNRSTFLMVEVLGAVFIILVGSALHFTYAWSGNNPAIGVFSAVNESVWEHLKLAFWPSLFFAVIEFAPLGKRSSNFAFAKMAGTCAMIALIPAVFYAYTAFTGESVFAVDIATFIVAVIWGQLVSLRLVAARELPKALNAVALAVVVLLAVTFAVFTFYPPHLPIFLDPVTGKYGIA
ncbi:MAG: DUF6512 family protein [Candidatus Bathyarchaeia archaeon]